MTEEEKLDEVMRRRRAQHRTQMKYRYRQMIFMLGLATFYFIVWKRIRPKPVMNSLIYHQALELLSKNPTVKKTLGENFYMMNCEGKIWPLSKKVNFNVTLFGEDKAKFRVLSQNDQNTWMLKQIDMITPSKRFRVL